MSSMESDFMESASSMEELIEASKKLSSTNLSKFLSDYTQNSTASKLALVLGELSDKPNKEIKFSSLLNECVRKTPSMNFVEAGHIVSSAGKIYGRKVDELHSDVVNYNTNLSVDEVLEGNDKDKDSNLIKKIKKSRKIIRAHLEGARKVELELPKGRAKKRERKRKQTVTSTEPPKKFSLNIKQSRKFIIENKAKDYFIRQAEFTHPKTLHEFSVMPDIDREDQPDSKRNYSLFTRLFDIDSTTHEPDLRLRFHEMKDGDDPWLAFSLEFTLRDDINEAKDLCDKEDFKNEERLQRNSFDKDVSMADLLVQEKESDLSIVDSAYEPSSFFSKDINSEQPDLFIQEKGCEASIVDSAYGSLLLSTSSLFSTDELDSSVKTVDEIMEHPDESSLNSSQLLSSTQCFDPSNLLSSTQVEPPERPQILSVLTIPPPLSSNEKDECIDSPDLIEPLNRSELPAHMKKALDIENGTSALVEETLRPLNITFVDRRSSMDNESGIGSSALSGEHKKNNYFDPVNYRIVGDIKLNLMDPRFNNSVKTPSSLTQREQRLLCPKVMLFDIFNFTDFNAAFPENFQITIKTNILGRLSSCDSRSPSPMPLCALRATILNNVIVKPRNTEALGKRKRKVNQFKVRVPIELWKKTDKRELASLTSIDENETELVGFRGRRDVFSYPAKKQKISEDSIFLTPPKLPGDKSLIADLPASVCTNLLKDLLTPGSPVSDHFSDFDHSIENECIESQPLPLCEASDQQKDGIHTETNQAIRDESKVEDGLLNTLKEGENTSIEPSSVKSVETPSTNKAIGDVTTIEDGSLNTLKEGENTSIEPMPTGSLEEVLPSISKDEESEEALPSKSKEKSVEPESNEIITLESSAKRVIYSLKLSDENFEKLLEENLDHLQKLYSEELKDPKLLERIKQAEERSKFDIKESCFRIIDKFPKTDDPLLSKPTMSLEEIMKDEDKTFVSKVILSILIMTNKGVVKVSKPLHFDENKPYEWSDVLVTLLTRKRSLISAEEAYAEFQHKKIALSEEKPTTSRPPPDITVSPPKVRRIKTIEKRRAIKASTPSPIKQPSPFTPHSPMDMDSGYDNDTFSETSGSISNFDNCKWKTNKARRRLTSPSITSLDDWE
ncbi:NCAPH2 family protein [Megaselia abdita]